MLKKPFRAKRRLIWACIPKISGRTRMIGYFPGFLLVHHKTQAPFGYYQDNQSIIRPWSNSDEKGEAF
jgi:hypothetical protein